ncbi:DUF1934 domain-containing protein [Streptococcus sp. H31]|uniref:DUF1934 domain-containing protein n=1 Tax=Streptococcus huangxiaojuni TaxID=3237239 RepID=UPI0034A2F3B9
MQVEIKNIIQIDNQTETIREVHDCQLGQKNGMAYILYQNTDKERVLLKYKEQELLMVRYSEPRTIMSFQEDRLTAAQIPTPLGLQKLTVETTRLFIQPENQYIAADYVLKQAETEDVFARYQLTVSWY